MTFSLHQGGVVMSRLIMHDQIPSSSRSVLALVLLALQHSHIAPEVTYIHISNIYIHIYLPFGIIDWLVIQERFTSASVFLLLHQILLCARVVALLEK